MQKIHISNLYTLSSYDGPKLVVDIHNFFVFTWNDYAPKNCIIDGDYINSFWVGFFLNKSKFSDFLDNKHSLYYLFESEKIHFCYLLYDFDTLVVDHNNFKFTVTFPDKDSYIEDDAKEILPKIGIKEFEH